jgi:hypothetical protein
MTDEFGGKKINGEINRYTDGPSEQDDPQVFLDALDRLLATPGVEAVRWQQYTPYFNDGEACTFRIYGAMVKIAGDDESVGDYEDGYRDSYNLYEFGPGGYKDKQYIKIGDVDGRQVYDKLTDFESVLESGAHFVVLNQKFGDPSEVTATKDGFQVEFYSHD